MSDHQPHSHSAGAPSSGLLLRISNLLILAVLVAIAALLYALNRRLDTLGQVVPPAAEPLPAVAALAPPPATQPAAPRAAARPAVNRNYTGATREVSTAIPPHDHSVASMATVQPVSTLPAATYPAVVSAPVEQRSPLPPPQAAAASDPQPMRALLPTGTILTVRMIHSLHSDTSRPGDRFSASLDEPIYANGMVAVPAGATAEGRVIRAERAGRVSGLSELSVQLDRLQLPSGDFVNLATEVVSRQGETSRGKDMATVGVGAAIGAAIGAIAGGRKGAGVGAATGAGAAGTEVLLSRGKPVVLSPETRLSFILSAPVEITAGGYSQSTSAGPASNLAPVWPAPRYDEDPFEGQRPRLRRRMM